MFGKGGGGGGEVGGCTGGKNVQTISTGCETVPETTQGIRMPHVFK